VCGILLAAAVVLSRRPPPVSPSPAPRAPTHPVALDRADPAVKVGLEELDGLRRMRAQRQIPMGGVGDVEYEDALVRLRQASSGLLYDLEEAALNRGEDVFLRVDLINMIAPHSGDETRRFLSAFVLDSSDDPAARIAALGHFMKYRDGATFEVLRAAWLDPAPFVGRYHLCLAFGENGQRGAIPILCEALAPDRPRDIRCHAALGLGGFVADEPVRVELRRLARADADPKVRQNAIASLCRSTDPEVDAFLKELASSSTADAETRRAAKAFLAQRGRNP